METFITTLAILFIAIELIIFSFCEYWRELHPWKWFFVKLLTTISLIIIICWGKETYGNYVLIAVALFGIATGIDYATAYNTANNTKTID